MLLLRDHPLWDLENLPLPKVGSTTAVFLALAQALRYFSELSHYRDTDRRGFAYLSPPRGYHPPCKTLVHWCASIQSPYIVRVCCSSRCAAPKRVFALSAVLLLP